MTLRILGALFILLGCGSFGFLIVGNSGKEIHALRNLVRAIDYMICDLQYKSTPLPELCRSVAKMTKGIVSILFHLLTREMEAKSSPNVHSCMTAALLICRDMPVKARIVCEMLGQRLGVFDLGGQVQMLSSLRQEAEQMLKVCEEGYAVRSRNCKTMAICAGAAIVILLI